MNKNFATYVVLNWVAVFGYVLASIANIFGVIFRVERWEARSYRLACAGLALHSVAIGYWWSVVGHGPYMAPSEVLSSDAWIAMACFLVFLRLFPRIKPASLLVFPATFLMIALAAFYDPGIRSLPATFGGVWLIFHIAFYKIALGTLLIALAFSIFYLRKTRPDPAPWLARLPELPTIDLYAYRFAGFGFIFWAIAMLAGSIWAYKSWGRFWGWDPVETWALITWLFFGCYLHLRRFFSWRGERAAWFFILCFGLSLVSLFVTSHLGTSIHAEYFK
jgi:ABC-type transport system involved in cytochrome c biogenesis permease subunit